MVVKFKKLSSNAKIPSYQTTGSAGMDISACLVEPLTLKPMQRAVVPTGLATEVPIGYEIQVRARSGLAAKRGISLVNGIGTIDSDYRGEIRVILVNLSDKDFVIKTGDRIAQLIVTHYDQPTIKEVAELSSTIRQDGGFGSTGI